MISYTISFILLIHAPVTCDVRTYRGGGGPQRVRDLRIRAGEPLPRGRASNERWFENREDFTITEMVLGPFRRRP